MNIGKVMGRVVSSQKSEGLSNFKLAIVQNIEIQNDRLSPTKEYNIAVDMLGANIGEYVLYSLGSSARNTTQTNNKPMCASGSLKNSMQNLKRLYIIKKRENKTPSGIFLFLVNHKTIKINKFFKAS